jgi:hypothetical protein
LIVQRNNAVPDAQPKLSVVDTPASTFRASFQDGRIAIDFGRDTMNAGGSSGVAVSTRILLDATTAVRLALQLRSCVQEHQARWRDAWSEEGGPAPARALTPSHAEPDESGQKAALLHRLVGALGVPYFHERSFRISEGTLAANRFLISIDGMSSPKAPASALLDLCRRLGMPSAALDQAQVRMGEARSVHFGFEGDGRVIFKFYLEQAAADREAAAARAGESVLLHLAFKWEANDPARCVTSRYLWFPKLSEAAIRERMVNVYRDSGDARPVAIAQAVLSATSGLINAENLQYLEVEEDANPRRSFDLNFYDAGLKIRDLQPELAQMRDLFSIRPGQFQAFYDQIRNQSAGHFAGGIHRDGRSFFNVYHGVERRKD